MDSAKFFVIVHGVYKNANEAFNQAVKDAQSKRDVGGNKGTIAQKDFFVSLEVPRGTDPLAFAKERAGLHGNYFWTYRDGPAACVEIKGGWIKNNQPKNKKLPKGFRMFVFFGWSDLKG